jgi:hypothetical protein
LSSTSAVRPPFARPKLSIYSYATAMDGLADEADLRLRFDVLTETRTPELHRYWTTRDRAANVRLFRLAAEILAVVDAGAFPPRVGWPDRRAGRAVVESGRKQRAHPRPGRPGGRGAGRGPIPPGRSAQDVRGRGGAIRGGPHASGLAALAHEQGDPEAARTHLADARAVFVALGLPMHVERAQQLARRLGISLFSLPVS